MAGFEIITLDGVQESTASGVPIGFVQILTGINGQPVGTDNPLAVQETFGPSGKDPVLANLIANGMTPVPFIPQPGRPFTVSGTFSNDAAGPPVVQLLKSYDAGATFLPVFSGGNPVGVFQQTFSQQFMEPEANVSYYVQMTERTAGGVSIRISQ